MADDLHNGHRKRMKERFLHSGLKNFESHNVLELLLFFAVPRKDTNELAHILIKKFGNFSEVCDAPVEELQSIQGMTQNAAILLKMIPELSSVYLTGKISTDNSLDTAEKLGEYFIARFLGDTDESVMLLCLDDSLNPIQCDTVSNGTLSSASIDIRNIIQTALRYNAARVVLAHNHPRGLSVPSNEDIIATVDIKKSLSFINIELVDHIIVSGNTYCSIKQRYPDL